MNVDTIIKWISTLAPFLATYPPFVKVLFAAWVILSAALLVALTLAQSGTRVQTSSTSDVWLLIDGLEFFAARQGAQVRVIANVNGTEFIYPSGAGVEWLEVGPSMSPQVFRLPPASERYSIRFRASVRVPARDGEPEVKGELTSVKEDIVNPTTDIPFTGRYVLHTLDPIHKARSASANAELRYRVTYDPK